MMNDMRRNEAYQRAIKKHVNENMLVLEIGTGAGLLSMMIAKAGANQVITCENIPSIAKAANHIIDTKDRKSVV